MKKFISLVIVVVLAFSLSACGNSEPEARKTVEGFMNAFLELDFENITNYTNDSNIVPEEFKQLNIEAIMETVPEELEPYSKDFEDIFVKLIDKVKTALDYEILDVTEEEDGFKYTLKVTYPNINVDFESLLENNIDQAEVSKIIEEMLASGELSGSSSEEEVMGKIMSKMVELINGAIDKIELETISEDANLYVKEVDGKWLIDAGKSNIN